MKKYINECCDCGLHCLGKACPNQNVPAFYCDRCGTRDVLYDYEGEELCIDCVKNELTVVEGSDY